jgi:hypothetical protein
MTMPVNDDGSYTVTVRVDDGKSGITTDSVSLTVNNVAPTLTATGAVTATNGSSYTLNLSASDPGDDTISGWTINWGDGTIETVVGDPSSVTHTYTNAGFSNNILVSATDEDGTYTPSDLLLTSGITDSLFRFEATDGSFTQEFANGSGINSPVDIEIGLDH